MLAASGVAGVFGAWVTLVGSDWSVKSAAHRADEALGLQDRLGTALSFGARPGTPTAAESIAIDDAERLAPGLLARRVMPMRPGAGWTAAAFLIGCAMATGLWVPVRHSGQVRVAQHDAGRPEREEAADLIAQSSQTIRAAAESSLRDVATGDELQRLEDFQRELLDGERDPAEALAESAQSLGSIAEKAERAAAQAAQADGALREQIRKSLTGRGAGDGSDSAPGGPLEDALSRGDLAAARDAADDLLQHARELPADQRERLAAELERLADRLDPAEASAGGRSEAAEPEKAPASPLDQALADRGVENSESLREQTDPAAVRQSLEEQGVSPQAAEPLAEKLTEDARRRESEQAAREDRQSLSDAARRAADELREPAPPEAPQDDPAEPEQDRPRADGTQAARQEGAGDDGERAGAAQREKQGDGERSADRPGADGQRQTDGSDAKPAPTPGSTPRSSSEAPKDSGQPSGGDAGPDPADGAGQRSSQGAGDQPGDQPGGEPKHEPGDQPPGEAGGPTPAEQPEARPTPEPGGQSGAARESPQGDSPAGEGAARTDETGDARGKKGGRSQPPGADASDAGGTRSESSDPSRPGADAPAAGGRSGASGGATDGVARQSNDGPTGVDGLRRELDRLASRPGAAQRMRDASKELRERADRLLEHASPEGRHELERLARGSEPPHAPFEPRTVPGATPADPGPWTTEPFDARSSSTGEPGEPGRVIADWYDSSAGPRPGASAETPSSTLPLTDAARGAERAIDRQVVPRSRSDLVRRVFERYRRRAESGAASPAGPSGGS
ncbi:MAG: hypothetical protein IPJ41_08605 [Phycisphaerales bacterium]|nr:hypothetical protein [Phycisphaerales bacterium]